MIQTLLNCDKALIYMKKSGVRRLLSKTLFLKSGLSDIKSACKVSSIRIKKMGETDGI